MDTAALHGPRARVKRQPRLVRARRGAYLRTSFPWPSWGRSCLRRAERGPPVSRSGLLIGLAVLAPGAPPLCRGQAAQTPAEMGAMDSSDAAVAVAAHEAMGGAMTEDPHMRLTPRRPGTAADSSRTARLVSDMRRDLGKYR